MKKLILIFVLGLFTISCATQNQLVKDLNSKISLSEEIIKQDKAEIKRLENDIEVEKSKIVTYKKQRKILK